MQTNPLVIPILDFLKNADSDVSILDIVSALGDESLFRSLSELPSEMVAFRKNFLVMNALYFLQRDLQGSGYALSVSAMSIQLRAVVAPLSSSGLMTQGDEVLAAYYLDWANYHDTDMDDIDKLLNDFWQAYQSHEKRQAALETLGLLVTSDWDQVQQVYRRLINQCHPDKGGCMEDFIRYREAYEILKRLYAK
ncbi:MAG: molecular chaperone DnaJ [Gammaproteobacteria bacterium]|nr:molecular chaperone DnaJ [Gammaproteobacteria bacterium]MDH5735703.1 molecular chaperone DnaJ [Gammaproteobacteria bacterium]